MIFKKTNLPIWIVAVAWMTAAVNPPRSAETFCFDDGTCVQPDGTLTTEDGQPICELDDSCEDASVETRIQL